MPGHARPGNAAQIEADVRGRNRFARWHLDRKQQEPTRSSRPACGRPPIASHRSWQAIGASLAVWSIGSTASCLIGTSYSEGDKSEAGGVRPTGVTDDRTT